MKFDTAIIGGGLAGLVAGIQLVENGQRCVIISTGQSALHFSSGSFDLLNTMPDNAEVLNPLESIKQFIKESPKHPYSKLGEENFKRLAEKAEIFFPENGIALQGTINRNHYRITPMGSLKPSWLSMPELATSSEKKELPWKKVAIFNITGFLDFYPQFIADEFAKLGTESIIQHFTLPEIDRLRRNPTELRATNLAWALDKEENIKELIKILKESSKDCNAIILPAVIGVNNNKTLQKLKDSIEKPIHLLATLPPSVLGIRVQQHLHKCFVDKGGVYMLGDSIQKADSVNQRIEKIYSYNHQDIPFYAKNYILASGSYFSQGLLAEQNEIIEPVFGLDISQAESRPEWYKSDMFDKQPYQAYGVKTNGNLQAIKNGELISNLYVAGAILEAFNPIKEGSGAGVSILTALYVAEQILNKD